MSAIQLAITDQATGKLVGVQLAVHDAKKLHRALSEILGDMQYQKLPDTLVTAPSTIIKIGG